MKMIELLGFMDCLDY